MSAPVAHLDLADGRRLAFLERGDPAGRPVLFLHGSPGSRLTGHPVPGQLVEARIRLLSYDRPGYGESDRRPGRTVVDAVADVTALLDHLGLDRVGVIGGSGGGPHALALAALAPERCTLVHCFVGVAPRDGEGLDFFAGMDAENVRRFTLAAQGLDAAEEQLGADYEAILERGRTQDPERLLGAMQLPPADLELLRRHGRAMVEAVLEGGRNGTGGFVDDFVAIAAPWGFDPRAVQAPLIVSYGAHDVNVPAGHGAWLAENVPTKDVRVSAGGGHLATPEEGLARLVELARA